LKAVIEKRTMVNLIQAFSVSLKHLLRGEPGIYYEDLYPLINFLPRYAALPSPGQATPEVTVDAATSEKVAGTLDQKKHSADTQDGTLPLWWTSPDTKLPAARKEKKQKRFDPESALPHVEAEIPLRPARNPPKDDFFYYFPIFLPLRWIAKALSSRIRTAIQDGGDERTVSGKRKRPSQVESNVPLEIWYVLRSNGLYSGD
jgi:putative membrane protein